MQFDRHGIVEVRRGVNTLASVTSSNVLPSRCTAAGDGLHKANVLKQTVVKVTARNSQGHLERQRGLPVSLLIFCVEADARPIFVSCPVQR